MQSVCLAALACAVGLCLAGPASACRGPFAHVNYLFNQAPESPPVQGRVYKGRFTNMGEAFEAVAAVSPDTVTEGPWTYPLFAVLFRDGQNPLPIYVAVGSSCDTLFADQTYDLEVYVVGRPVLEGQEVVGLRLISQVGSGRWDIPPP